MKIKKFTILHLLSFYLIQISLIPSFLKEDLVVTPIIFMVLINLVMYVIAVVKLNIINKDISKLKDLLKSMLIIKIGTIAFFIINYAIYVIIFIMFSIFPPGNLFVALIGVLFTFACLIGTSTYSVIAIICALKNNKISKTACVFFIISQFIFCVDVLTSIIIYIKLKKPAITD